MASHQPPKRSQNTTWREFIAAHMAVLVGADFFGGVLDLARPGHLLRALLPAFGKPARDLGRITPEPEFERIR
jgi:hypothetical protein